MSWTNSYIQKFANERYSPSNCENCERGYLTMFNINGTVFCHYCAHELSEHINFHLDEDEEEI